MPTMRGFLALGLLAGCAFTPYTTHFECPVGKGVPCTRLSVINGMIDDGKLGREEAIPHGLMCGLTCLQRGPVVPRGGRGQGG